jgi:Ca-activated chloride channel family protein
MKTTTVALLAALGMLTTGATVWSVTPPGYHAPTVTPELAGSSALATTGTAIATQSLDHFDVGATLRVEGRVGHARLLRGTREELLLLDVEGSESSGAARPAPVDLAIVIDRSGSMKGTRFANAIAGARRAVDRLHDGDIVSILAFDTRTELVVPPTTLSPGTRAQVEADLGRIALGGDTCISCGIEEGLAQLASAGDRVTKMIVLSDGDANHGVRDVPGFRSMAARARERGVAITTIGVDVDYNEKILSAIAQESNGRHYFVENDAGLERVFDEEAQTLTATVASGAEARIELAPGVELDKVFDRSFRRDGRAVVVPLGSFSAGETKTVLVRVRVPESADGDVLLANVDLAYRDQVAGGDGRCEGKLGVTIADAGSASPLDPVVSGRLARSETIVTLQNANALFAQGKLEEARRTVQEQKARVSAVAKRAKTAAATEAQPVVDKDFDRQLAVLGQAADGFATPPAAAAPAAAGGPFASPAPAPPQATRAGKAATRLNEQNRVELGF